MGKGGRNRRDRRGVKQAIAVPRVAGMISAREDEGDDCSICLFIRARADRAGPSGMIPLSAGEVAELRGLMAGKERP